MEIKISEIKEFVDRRDTITNGIEIIQKSMEQTGFLDNNPIVVTRIPTGGYKLIDGRHRYEAANNLNLSEIPVIIKDNLSDIEQYQLASQCNNAAEIIVPNNFVSDAEFIWRKADELNNDGKKKYTQADVGKMLGGWSRGKVSNYAMLDSISPIAWEMIATDISIPVAAKEKDSVAAIATNVAITEGLLRNNLLDLTELHQKKIIQGLIDGKIKNSQVKRLAKTYAEREEMAETAINDLLDVDAAPEFFNTCIDGLYKTIEQTKKAVKQANDEFEKKNSIRVLQGDCLELLKDIEDESCDALIVDPPYAILSEAWDSFESKEDFLTFSEKWIKLATEKVKSTGRIYIFWSQEFMFDFPFDAVSGRFEFSNMLVWNYKNNIKPSNQRKYKYTYEPCFYFYGENAAKLNLPNNQEWDENTNDYDVFTIAQPQTNFKDAKEHPAQKPKKLISQLINIGSDIGDTILDCFAGSGTTGVCCKALKRKAILMEQNDDYIKIIKRKLNE